MTDPDKFDIKLNRATTIDVTELNFPHKAPEEAAPIKIADIKTLPARQQVSEFTYSYFFSQKKSYISSQLIITFT